MLIPMIVGKIKGILEKEASDNTTNKYGSVKV